MSRRIVQFPVTLSSANRKVDKSVSLRFTTNLEVTNADFALTDTFVGRQGWVLFAENELNNNDVPKEPAPGDVKRPSQRLRGILWAYWDQMTDRSEPFEIYYDKKMEGIIEGVKAKLPDRF